MTEFDYHRPIDFLAEREPFRDRTGNSIVDVNTLFLTGRRCPIGCNMCDLHAFTREDSPPVGATVDQIDHALRRLPPASWIKLYNSGNFFDAASLPPADYDAIARRCEPFDRVIVENHPKIGRHRHLDFARRLRGKLEVAVGLESVQPRVLSRIGKRMTRDEFDRYAGWLTANDIDLRVFLIIGSPGIKTPEAVRWAKLSLRHAIAVGARHISLLPVRNGAGWGEDRRPLPTLTLQTLCEVFDDAIASTQHCCISIDLWEFKHQTLQPSDQNRLRCLSGAILEQRAVMHEAV
ncbi:Fe-S oxidoreductase [Roseiconus lacunae]|uniref:Fe-S oxidoreductase n=1 Tax=Roseiconus lacunae TaxID=2605694 RepID=UPI0011F2C7D1|nr:Fe-S oxidoreductase [Roseiconus lacunae]